MVPEFLQKLEAHGTAKHALWDKNDHKSPRKHWGVPAPDNDKLIREVIKPLSDEDRLKFTKELWQTNIFDAMISASKVAAKCKPSEDL